MLGRNIERTSSTLILWKSDGPKLQFVIRDLASGQVLKSFTLKLPNVVSILPLDAQTFALQTFTGIHLLDITSQALTPHWCSPDYEFLDFGSLAYDPAHRKLLVLTTGNLRRPGSRLTLLDL